MIARLSAPAQNIQVWMASVLFRLQPTKKRQEAGPAWPPVHAVRQ
jgi:hypothetical protein